MGGPLGGVPRISGLSHLQGAVPGSRILPHRVICLLVLSLASSIYLKTARSSSCIQNSTLPLLKQTDNYIANSSLATHSPYPTTPQTRSNAQPNHNPKTARRDRAA